MSRRDTMDDVSLASPSSQQTLVSSPISLPFAAVSRQSLPPSFASPSSVHDRKSLASRCIPPSFSSDKTAGSADPLLAATSATRGRSKRGTSAFHSNNWRRKFELVITALAVVSLLAWIVAAGVLAAKKVFLLLDFFSGVLTADAYNVVISVLAAVLSITVGAALARGFRSVLRRRLKSQDGLSLEDYDALVNFADGNLHYRFRFVAIAVFAVFFISQLMGPATQAAFGQSPSTQQKTDAFNLTRLVDNLTYATESLEVSVNSFPAADIDKSATQAMLSVPTRFSAGTDNFSTQVFDTTEISTHGVPLFEASLPQERLARFENTTGSAGDAADVVISTPAEAFYATVVCSNVTSTLPSTIEVSNKTLAVEIEPRCGAGNRTFIWRRDLIFIGDTHACDGVDGPLVYVLQANTTGGVLRSVFECTVSASSAVLPVVVVPRNNSAYITGSPVNRSDIPSSFPLGAYLGEDLLNSFGSSGWLAFTRVIGGANVGLDQQKLAEILVETVAKIELTHAQYFVSASLEANSSVQAAKVSIPFLSSFLSTVLTGTLPMCSTNSPPSRSTFTAGNSPSSSSPPSFSSSSSPSPPSSSPMGPTSTTPPTPSSPPSSGFLRRRTGGSARLGMSRSREGRGFGSRKCWAGREVEPLTRSVC